MVWSSRICTGVTIFVYFDIVLLIYIYMYIYIYIYTLVSLKVVPLKVDVDESRSPPKITLKVDRGTSENVVESRSGHH